MSTAVFPGPHAAEHAAGGGDPLTISDVGPAVDITSLGYEHTAARGMPGGYPALDADGVVHAAQLPPPLPGVALIVEDGATTIDASTGGLIAVSVLLTADTTFTLTAPADGVTAMLALKIRSLNAAVPTFGSAVHWAADAEPDWDGGGAVDVVTLVTDDGGRNWNETTRSLAQTYTARSDLHVAASRVDQVWDNGPHTFTYPGAAQSGDLAYILICWAAANDTFTTPSGWTAVRTVTNAATKGALWRRTLSTERDVSITWDTDGVGAVIGFVAVRNSTGQDVTAGANTTAAALVAPSVTTTTANDLLLAFAANTSEWEPAITPPAGPTLLQNPDVTGNGTSMAITYEPKATAGATATRTFVVAGGGVAVTVAVKP